VGEVVVEGDMMSVMKSRKLRVVGVTAVATVVAEGAVRAAAEAVLPLEVGISVVLMAVGLVVGIGRTKLEKAEEKAAEKAAEEAGGEAEKRRQAAGMETGKTRFKAEVEAVEAGEVAVALVEGGAEEADATQNKKKRTTTGAIMSIAVAVSCWLFCIVLLSISFASSLCVTKL
jgi:hypothetical protein